MKLLPLQNIPLNHPVDPRDRVPTQPATSPVGRIDVARQVGQGERQAILDPFEQERLIQRYDRLGGAKSFGRESDLRTHRAVEAYHSIHLAGERQALNELLGVDLYA